MTDGFSADVPKPMEKIAPKSAKTTPETIKIFFIL
jgi:hypothetical protein